MPKRAIVLIVSLLAAGCTSMSPEELDRLTKEDPAFKQMISSRDEVHFQIRQIREDLLTKKKAMDAQIDSLRKAYDAYARTQHLKIEKYKATIEANRKILERDIEAAQAELDVKERRLQEYRATQEDIQKIIGNQSLKMTEKESDKWQERETLLSEKIRPLVDEIQELRLRIRLKQQKIKFLK